MYGRLIVLLFTLLLFVNISVFSSYGNSTGDQVIEKFDSGFYEKIQDKINSFIFNSIKDNQKIGESCLIEIKKE